MKQGKRATRLLILVFLVGLSLLLYPSVSDYWNSFHQSQAITQYAQGVAKLDDGTYERLWTQAQRYNQALTTKADRYALSPQEEADYNTQLDVTGDGVMGYVEIPAIRCSLPICHGTDEAVLQRAVGHIAGSSLPVGGAGSHCVLSGHRGLPSAKLFSNLDQMVEGDTFFLRVLDETLAYEVDQILIVDLQDLSALALVPGQDYCTLVTCTPYGVNTHRLLVRGHRVAAVGDNGPRITADAAQIEPVMVAPLVAAPMLLLLLGWVVVTTNRKKKFGKGGNHWNETDT